MKTRAWNPPSLRFGATRMEDSRWNTRSVLECGGPPPLLNRSKDSALQSARGLAQSKTWRIFGALLTFLAITISVRAQSYSIDWYKISGGGGTSTGGGYTVTGTIGQPDAGATMSDGYYTLTGGYWALYAVQTPGAPVLSITYAGNRAIVSWNPFVTGWTLQTNVNLATPTWGNYLGPIVNNSVTNVPPPMNLFFRLKQ